MRMNELQRLVIILGMDCIVNRFVMAGAATT